jgi:DegV family protein with EDD domain
MAGVAIITDSTADLAPEAARALGVTVVPLEVTFGDRRFRAGVDLSTEEFWARMTAPDAPFPTTAAASPGQFREAFEASFAAGAEAVVCVSVTGTLSGTIKSALIAKDMLPEREIHVVDSRSVSMAEGILVEMGCEMAASGRPASEIAATLADRAGDTDLYLALDTLEYLRKGGRISAAVGAGGGLISMKLIITVRDGQVVPVDRIRTRSKARERCLELLTARPVERVAVLHTTNADVESFRAELMARLAGRIDPAMVSVETVGASVGPHLGPGSVGAVVLYAR